MSKDAVKTVNFRHQNGPHKNANHSDDIDLQMKNLIISKIYEMIDLSKFKYRLIETIEDMEIFNKFEYSLSANYAGTNCLLVFLKINDTYHSFLVDRKTLSYNFSQLNLSNVNIIPIKVRIDRSIYDGTIFDGIYIENPRTGERTFIINDFYYFCGTNTTHDKLQSKIGTIAEYIPKNIKDDPLINDILITVNRLYSYGDIEKLVYKIIPKVNGYVIKGITFHPEISGTKLIYLFEKNNNRVINNFPQQMHINKQSYIGGSTINNTYPITQMNSIAGNILRNKDTNLDFIGANTNNNEVITTIVSNEEINRYLL